MSELNQEFVPDRELEKAIDRILQLEAENAKLKYFFGELSKKHHECVEGKFFTPEDLEQAEALLSLGVLGVLGVESVALALAVVRTSGRR